MNNEQNNIQAKLEKWAEDTVKAYHQIATRDDVNIAYYTQSDLSLLSEEPELMIVGINPGNPYGITPYTEQCKNKNWSYLHNNPLDKNHLLKGNYCKVEGKPSSWDAHREWKYWSGLRKCLSQTYLYTVIDDDNRIVITNASFFSTKNANDIKESLLAKSIPFTLSLIKIINPTHLFFLSGKKCFERLYHLSKSSKQFLFEYKNICGNIYVGILNNKYCIGIPHPTYKTREELNLVASVLPFLLNVTDYENIDNELIRRECSKQIQEYEDRQKVNQPKRKKKVDSTRIIELIITSPYFQLTQIEKENYSLSKNLMIRITKTGNGYLAIRHKNYDVQYPNSKYDFTERYRNILMEKGWNCDTSVWLGKKLIKDYGCKDDEIVTKIVSEINDIVELVNKDY
jgi:hypothetical protein